MYIFKSFKKIFIIIMIICILIGISNKVFAAMLTLNQVVDKFNSSNPMAEHLKDTYDATVVASLEGNKIILTENNSPFIDSKIQKVEFNLENNILSTTISKSTESTTAYMSELSMTWMLIDCIGQLNGYEKEQFYETLKGTGDNYKNYTLSKEGLEIKTIDNNSTSIKIDLSKKIPIINEETEMNEDSSKNTEDANLNSTDKANKTKNEIQDNTIKEKQNNEVLNVNKKEDNTTTNSKLPQTGSTHIILIVIPIVLVSLYFYKKYLGYDID